MSTARVNLGGKFADSTATKFVQITPGGTAGTTTTLVFSQTSDRTITYPDTTDTLMGVNSTASMTNKNLVDTSTFIIDAVDATKRIGFNAGGTTGTTTTLTAAQTSDRVITLPDAAVTLVGSSITSAANEIATYTSTTGSVVGRSNIIASLDATVRTLLLTNAAIPTLGATAFDNLIIGYNVGKVATSPLEYQGCTLLGSGAARLNTANFVTAVGTYALYNANAIVGSVTAIGSHALYSTTNAHITVAIGTTAGYNDLNSSQDILVGHRAGYSLAGSATNVVVGSFAAGYDMVGSARTSFNNNVMIGHFAGYSSAIANNVQRNIFIGYQAGNTVTSNTDCIYLDNVGVAAETATIRVGTAATHTKAFIAGIRGATTGIINPIPVLVDANGQLGTGALTDTSTTIKASADDTKVIAFSVSGATTGTTTTLIFSQTTSRAIVFPNATTTLVGTDNSATLTNKNLSDTSTFIVDVADATKRIGFNANTSTGTTTTITATSTADRIITLPNATTTLLGCTTSGSANAIPVFSATNIVTTSNIIASVDTSLFTLLITSTATPTLGASANDNVLLGIDAGKIGTSPLSYQTCTFLGAHAGAANTSSSTTAVGAYALYSHAGAGVVTAFGAEAARNATSVSADVFIGRRAGYALTSGNSNVIIGSVAAGGSAAGLTSFTNNVMIGAAAGGGVGLTGTLTNNVFIGATTGSSATSNANCVYISHNGVAAETATQRYGTSGTHTKTFIAGIRGITTGVADAIAVLIDSSGQLGTTSSSLKYKENVVDMTGSEIIYQMRPVMFNFIGQTKESIGLIAEEVEQIYPEMAIYQPITETINDEVIPVMEEVNGESVQKRELLTVDYARLPILLLAEVQKLRAELDALKAAFAAQ